ncbi:MAG: glycerophosphodiester phosphodiesterase [Gemmatimonadetes bacterium]|nr:glycerophosphodiester phosphodiesterase [Gemmatimonadota bacterium]MCC6773738.1 glycerophosphodiester phosphodiesterase [Gemmatimonadaceae bacterium]
MFARHFLSPPVLGALLSLVAASCARPGTPPALPAPEFAMDEVNHGPLIIAHRGASGHRPEHTREAYSLAIEMGADYIEPDLVMTRDRVLVSRHENEIGGTTDVADRFPSRRRTQVIDGEEVTGWFTEDFTLAELKTLRAHERLPSRSHAFDGRFEVPTLDEVLTLVRASERATGRTIGVYPETKHPSHFAAIGLPLEDSLLATLARHGYHGRDDAVFIQSFETGNLRGLRTRTSIRLVQLVDVGGAPADLAAAGDPRGSRDLVTAAGLGEIATYADAVGVHKALVLPPAAVGAPARPTTLVRDAHAAGLAVHVWTLRSDAPYLGAEYAGDAAAEWRAFAAAGVDGMFGDFPDVGVRALGRSVPPR